MSDEADRLKRSTAELRAALDGIRDSAEGLVYFRTELEHTLRVLRQANNAAESHRRFWRWAALGAALLGGLLGVLTVAWLAHGFLGG